MSSRTVYCTKLKKEAPGLATPPYPGPIGEKIFAEISAEAWKGWIGRQTILINEHRLSLAEPQARAFLEAEMEKYFFGSEE